MISLTISVKITLSFWVTLFQIILWVSGWTLPWHQNQTKTSQEKSCKWPYFVKGSYSFPMFTWLFFAEFYLDIHTSNFRDLESMFVLVNNALHPILFSKYLFITTIHEVYWRYLQEPSAHCVKTICMWVWPPPTRQHSCLTQACVSSTSHRPSP